MCGAVMKMPETLLSGGIPSASQPHLPSVLSFLWETVSRQRPRTFPTQETNARTSLLAATWDSREPGKPEVPFLHGGRAFFSSM